MLGSPISLHRRYSIENYGDMYTSVEAQVDDLNLKILIFSILLMKLENSSAESFDLRI